MSGARGMGMMTTTALVPAARLITPELRSQIGNVANSGRNVPSAPFNIVPPECASVVPPTPATQVAAGQVAVFAFPFVKLSDSQIQQLLDLVYGGGQGGDALVTAIGTGSVPNFVASGWIADTDGNAEKTRGAIWLAFGWPSPMTGNAAKVFAQNVIRDALKRMGIDVNDARGPMMNVRQQGVPIIAQGTSDQQLTMAAMSSATGVILAMEALAIIFTAGGAQQFKNLTVSVPQTREFVSTIQALANCAAAAGQALGAVQAADVAAQAALGAPVDQAAQNAAALGQVKAQLVDMKTKILAGPAAAMRMTEYVAAENDPNGNLASQIRNQIVSNIRDELNKIDIGLGREFRKCAYYGWGQRSLNSQLSTLGANFAQGAAMANAILTQREQLGQLVEALDAAIANVEKAISQLPLSWLERDLAGVPVYLWLGGTMFVVIGGALAVKKLRKPKAPTPNRRRRRRRA